ncbi:hypothetical protein HKX69_15900 [Streptomyces argyrophyllae]|uniref:Uncharacterized protein n=1 Tax=Streptomyces argyrophylli TaxID=2726118 RepID=A0A6M4PJP1_9ACTN|nr:hypothetical protein [Streptomyces argyrophyllae]QJS10799.1 hypothetical protein HKX69_15900 [Streptomyces argyrophyllae]
MGKLTEEQRQQRARAGARRKALQAEEDDRHQEEKREQWQREGMYLSREELIAGHPCRGCGEPILDGLGNRPPLLRMTSEERAEYDAEEARYKERHGECRAHRWTVSGSRTQHCGHCCPPPPMGEEQARAIAKILFNHKTDKRHLNDWDLTLTCDHTIRRTQHRDHQRYSTSVVQCPTCGERRGVIEAVLVGPTEDSDGKVQQERLATELRAAKAKLERQRKAAIKTEQRIADIAKELGGTQG